MYRKSNGIATALLTSEEVKEVPFPTTWRIYKKINDCLYILYNRKNGNMTYAPLYVDTFRFINNRHLTNAQIFLYKNPSPENLSNISDKLKWYRYQNGLLQNQIAEILGVDRTTYSRYEQNLLEAYPLDKLLKAADFFEIDITDLLDDYNLFLYKGQREQIKSLRKRFKLTQAELAKYMSVSVKTVKRWEQNEINIQKKTFKKLLLLQEGKSDVSEAH